MYPILQSRGANTACFRMNTTAFFHSTLILAVLFKDDATAEKIMNSDSPKKQKALGRQVKNFDEGVWKENCRNIVKNASRAKVGEMFYGGMSKS